MKKIAIYGAGGFGREVEVLLQQINANQEIWQLSGYFDDNLAKGDSFFGAEVLGNINDLNNYTENISIVIAIGDSKIRRNLVSKIKNKNVSFPNIIHPSVILNDYQRIKIGEGCIICSNSTITTDIIIGNFTIVNLNCTIGHDAIIGNYCSFMPSVNISGETKLGDEVYMGVASCIINQVNIDNNVIVGAGSIIIRDIPSNSLVVGNPGKIIKKINE